MEMFTAYQQYFLKFGVDARAHNIEKVQLKKDRKLYQPKTILKAVG